MLRFCAQNDCGCLTSCSKLPELHREEKNLRLVHGGVSVEIIPTTDKIYCLEGHIDCLGSLVISSLTRVQEICNAFSDDHSFFSGHEPSPVCSVFQHQKTSLSVSGSAPIPKTGALQILRMTEAGRPVSRWRFYLVEFCNFRGESFTVRD